MNILYLITSLSLGGAETITINIANEMQKKKHRIAILYLTGENWFENRINEQIVVRKIAISKNPFGFLMAQVECRQFINEFRPEVVHANMFHAVLFARLLRLHCHIPFLISTEHNKFIGGELRMKLYRYTDYLSDLNTNVSEEATCHFISKKAFGLYKSRTVYNGINLTRFQKNEFKREEIRTQYSISDIDFLFLNVGRLTEAKDQKNLLKAFKKVHILYPHTKLIIVGEGELETNLKIFIQKLELHQFVSLAGAHSNIEDYYCAADCFVLSSAWEGFGLVLAEAMATSLPVITTDAGGCAEVINDVHYVVPTHNSSLLAEKMEEMVMMPLHDRIILGSVNETKTQRFDLKKIIEYWSAIYSDSLVVKSKKIKK